MSLSVFVAHSGKRLDADPAVSSTLDALKNWISNETDIPPQDQILLSMRGKHVKPQTLLAEKEIFLYNRDLFALPAPSNLDGVIPPQPSPDILLPAQPPSRPSGNADLQAWQSLFSARHDWALRMRDQCRSMAHAAATCAEEQAVVERGVAVAIANLENHFRALVQKHHEASTWLDEVAREQHEYLQSWEADLARLGSIPANRQFCRFISTVANDTQRPSSRTENNASATLDSFVEADMAKQGAAVSPAVVNKLERCISDVGKRIEWIRAEYNQLQSAMDSNRMHSTHELHNESTCPIEEIDGLVHQVDSDCRQIRDLTASRQSAAQLSKITSMHTHEYTASIAKYGVGMKDILKNVTRQRGSAVRLAIGRLQKIASIESALADANVDVASIAIAPKSYAALEALSLISKMPYIYGMLLIEGVRRHEWAERLKKDSSSLAEEIARYRIEEDRRRNRWLQSNRDVVRVDVAHDNAVGIDINVTRQDAVWPLVVRRDVHDYLNLLQSIGGLDAAVDPLREALCDLDRPTRQQINHAKGFKAGSVHEGLGTGSLLLRGQDEARVLRESMSKLEEELKGSKSRVRKLEDLLHRQNHSGRMSIGSGIAPPSSQLPSTPTTERYSSLPSPKLQDIHSQPASASSHSHPVSKSAEERALTQRVVELEDQLKADSDARVNSEREYSTRVDDLQSTNKSLEERLEKIQRDWSAERQSLEDDRNRLLLKVTQLKEDQDKAADSRDKERAGHAEQQRALQADLDHAHIDADRLLQANQELQVADTKLKATLQSALSSLEPGRSLPDNNGLLAFELKDRIEDRKSAAVAIREALETEIRKVKSLSEDLDKERAHVSDLQTKVAQGEATVETLRQRLADEEAKVATKSTGFAEASAQVKTLERQLVEEQNKYKTLQANSRSGLSRSEQQHQRVRDLSEKLLANNDRLHRLLETLGFAITLQDNRMVIQRASKVVGQSTLFLGETSTIMNRSVSLPLTSHKIPEGSGISEALRWMEQDDPDTEAAKYGEFLETIRQFDMDTFSEAMIKRMRDMEHTARKWQRSSRGFEDNFHKYQGEAREKLAIRGFKEGDLALFLPTRNQATRPWAAFNVGAPHYFLREQESHRLHNKEWLVARITKVEERVVDLTKSMDGTRGSDGRSITSGRGGGGGGGFLYEDDNPFALSDGLRWHLVEAAEEKVGAPFTPGLGKSTVDSTKVDAGGSIRMKKSRIGGNDASKTLNKSLDSRRSSAGSKRSMTAGNTGNTSNAIISGGRGNSSTHVAGCSVPDQHNGGLTTGVAAEEVRAPVQ